MESLPLYALSFAWILLSVTKSAVILTVLFLFVTRLIVKVNTSLMRSFTVCLVIVSLWHPSTLVLSLALGEVMSVLLSSMVMLSLFMVIAVFMYGKYIKVDNVSIGYKRGLKIAIPISIIISFYYAGTLYMTMQMLGARMPS